MAIFRTAAVSLTLASVVIAVLLLILELQFTDEPLEPVPAPATPSAITLEERRDLEEGPESPDGSDQVTDPPRSPVQTLIPTATPIFGVSPEAVLRPDPTDG
jgi:hypothetical protein